MRGILICFCKPCDLGHNQSGAGYTIDHFVIAVTWVDGHTRADSPFAFRHLILYRSGMTDPVTLTLTGTPVDGEHAPQLGQGVEMGSEADLANSNFIAAPPASSPPRRRPTTSTPASSA